jgi:glyoxalase-like protein
VVTARILPRSDFRDSMMPMTRISRRAFSIAASSLAVAPNLAWPASRNVPKSLDHVILGCSDLDAGVDYVYQRTGVRAAAGGVHPGAGTRNALLSLGTLRYLEIIAPDPLQAASTDPRHVASLKNPALVGWAIHRTDVDQFAAVLQSAGVDSVGPKPGSRARPDGTTLTWKSLALKDDSNGVLPFFIEWGSNSLHPSVDAPAGCTLADLSIGTPTPAKLAALTRKLQLDVQLHESNELQLAAIIVGPKGNLPLLSSPSAV